MHEFFSFIWGVVEFLFFISVVLAVIAFLGYNNLRTLAEQIKEAWSNIGIAGRKQVKLINQLQDVVKTFQDSESFVMLKVSDDMTSANGVSQMHQQSSMVLSTLQTMERRFPEMKSNQNYQRLIDSVQNCENEMEAARQSYNKCIKAYNTKRSSIPTVFYANFLGFKAAPYLEFDGGGESADIGTMKSFTSDDGERLNALMGQAGNKLLSLSSKAIEAGKDVTQKALESGIAIAEKAQDKIHESKANSHADIQATETPLIKAFCTSCGSSLNEGVQFCGGCGTKR